MNSPLTHIGTSEAISLPDYKLENVPAKVDTGADSSAIWASNIFEKDGELHFTLFGLTSPFYTGEEIKTRKYSLVTVKNSFGQKEVRYKVVMKLGIGGRKIVVRITLANRSNNRFPILIGRRTLKGKFLVDVSKKSAAIGNQRVLFLVANHTEANEGFADFTKRQEGIEVNTVAYEDLIFKMGGDGNSIVIAASGEDVADFGLVYFGVSRVKGRYYVAASIAQYLENRHVDFIDQIVNQCPETAKIYQYVTLSDASVPIPKTLFMLPTRLRTSFERLVAELGLPFVLKDVQGAKGANNFLINSKADFERALRQADDLDVWMLAQEYIPNDHDYRLLVMGGQAALVLRRAGGSDTHLNNVSTGGKATLEELTAIPASLVNASIAATKLLKLQIAGVDLLQDKDSKLWYCLEVNKAPQIYSGAYTVEKQTAAAKYISQRLLN